MIDIKPGSRGAQLDITFAEYTPTTKSLFRQFHAQLSDWRAERRADLQCEANSNGVTYQKSSKAFVWVDFNNSWLRVLVPGVDPACYKGAEEMPNTPDQIKGARIRVSTAEDIPIAIRAIQDAYADPKL